MYEVQSGVNTAALHSSAFWQTPFGQFTAFEWQTATWL
jgi:hypothetical protein